MNRRDIFKLFAGSAAMPAVKSVENLKVEKDDIVVLKFPHRCVVILENGADISVLRKEQL